MSLDLDAKQYVITGASTGVGRATAVALAARGATVVLACRSRDRGERVAAEIAARGRGHARVVELELGDLSAVRRAADRIAPLAPRLDALVLNAATAGARGVTRDGFELAFGVNYLGHFALACRLVPELPTGARVVHLGSGSHATVRRLDFDPLLGATRSWTGIREYAVSKLCVMLFHHELARRAPGVVSVAADPGDVASDAWRHVPWPIRPWITRHMKPPSEGAEAPLRCATDPRVQSGASYTAEGDAVTSALARDRALGRELWERSVAWIERGPAC